MVRDIRTEFPAPATSEIDESHAYRESRLTGELMVIADRLKALRVAKHLSQLDIQQRTGLLRCYISRVENGHTVPEIETLEKFAGALEVPMYQLFHEGDVEASVRKSQPSSDPELFGTRGAEADYLSKLRQAMSKLKPNDQKLILRMVQKVAKRA